MLATEHEGGALNPAGWRVAVVVLRYFVAVRLAQHLACEASAAPVGLARVKPKATALAQVFDLQ